MNMVEKMARAAFDSLHGDTHTGGWDFGAGDVNISEEHKERFRKIARAVLTALSEPTEEMQIAAFSQKVSFRSGSGMSDIGQVSVEYEGEPEKGAATIWKAMLAAASKD